jgi:integrase
MTRISMRALIAEELADVGQHVRYKLPTCQARSTAWLNERGLGVRRYASGRAVYIVQTRMSGRCRTITIAPTSVITEHRAATIARRVMAHAEVGHVPADDRLRIRSAPMFQDFLDEYWKRTMPRWKKSSCEMHASYRRLYLEGSFPGISIDEISEGHVTRWFAALNNNTGPGAANRVLAILNAMLNKAEEWGYRSDGTNPCRSVRRNKTRKIERFLSVDELRRLGDLLAVDQAVEGSLRSTVAAAVTLLLLTGCRASEVAGLQWQDVSGNRLKLRDSKTGPRTVWLGDYARALLDALPRSRNIPWVFWNSERRTPLLKLSNYWPSIRVRSDLSNVRLHDLRHTFASHAAMNKETLSIIGRLLGHRSLSSTSCYAHLGDEHVSGAAQQIGTAIERLLS